jgi:hypothetical protein
MLLTSCFALRGIVARRFGGIGSAPVKSRGHPGPRAELRVNKLFRPQQPLSAHVLEDFRMILQSALPRAALRPKVALDS